MAVALYKYRKRLRHRAEREWYLFGTDGKAVKPQTVIFYTVDNGVVIGGFSTVSKERNNFIMVL